MSQRRKPQATKKKLQIKTILRGPQDPHNHVQSTLASKGEPQPKTKKKG